MSLKHKLVAYYKTTEGNGNVSFDSVNHLNGTIVNLNRVPNGNMENDYGWPTYVGNTLNERSSTKVHGGTFSRHLIVDASNKGAQSNGFPVVSGHTYRVSCWVWTVVGSTGKARIRRNDARIDFTITGSTTGQWELLTADVVAGSSGLDRMRLEGSGSGEFYFDDASVVDLADVDNSIPGTCYQFDGVNDYVELPISPVFSPAATGQFSVSCVINPDVLDFVDSIAMGGSEGGAVHFLGKDEPSQSEWVFRMYNKTGSSRPNRISFYVFNPTGGEGIGAYFQDTLVAGEPIHLVGTVDGKYVKLYKNGVLRQATDYTIDQGYAGPLTLGVTDSPVRFGTTALNTSDFGWFQGTIKKVGFWSRELSEGEIKQLYNKGDVLDYPFPIKNRQNFFLFLSSYRDRGF